MEIVAFKAAFILYLYEYTQLLIDELARHSACSKKRQQRHPEEEVN